MRPIDADALTEFLKCLLPEKGMWEIEGDTVKNAVCETVAEAIEMVKNMETIHPEKSQLSHEGTTSDLISKFIDDLEEIFAHIREKHVDDSVCGLCEYDGAYIGQSGDWCNECPGFNRDDCFKLSDETRKKWTEEIINALPTIQPEPQWIPVSERVPTEDGKYMVTIHGRGWNGKTFTSVSVAECIGNRWVGNNGVIAWMPLPEPYKPNK